MSNRKILLFYLLTYATISCKQTPVASYNGDNQNTHNYPEGFSGSQSVVFQKKTPKIFPSTCTPDRALADLGMVTLRMRVKEKEQNVTFNLSNVPGNPLSLPGLGNMLKGKVIAHIYEDCTATGPGVFSCDNSVVKTTQPGTPIYICESNPKPGTLEHETLAAFIGLYQLKIAFPKDFSLSEVLFFPSMVDQILPRKGTPLQTSLTDNAYWSRDGEGKNRIIFLPHSQEMAYMFPIPIWRQQTVAAHEGGHQIFFKYGAPLFSSQSKLREEDETEAGSFDDTTQAWMSFEANAQEGSTTISTRKATMGSVISSMNEGAADIYAAIASGLQESLFGNGFEYQYRRKARDPFSKTNDDGKIKAITNGVLKHFFNDVATLPDSQLTPNHQDSHTLGAIFAYIFLALFEEEITRWQLPTSEQTSRCIAHIKEWQARLVKAYERYPDRNTSLAEEVRVEDPKQFLRYLMQEMVNVYALPGKRLTQAQCNIIITHLPAFIPSWKKTLLASCPL